MRTLDLIECSDFLKVDRKTVMKLAGRGELIGAKIGRAWVFLEEDVVIFLRKKATEQTTARLQGAYEPEADAMVARAIARQMPVQDQRRPGRRARPVPSLSPYNIPDSTIFPLSK